jgi:protease-4
LEVNMTQLGEGATSGSYIRERTLIYLLVALLVGFALPVCSCFSIGMATISGISRLGGDAPTLDVATSPAVAVIRLEGTIVDQENVYAEYITPGQVSALIERAEQEPMVRAIVLRINSPGGGVVASDEIYRMLLETDLPVVVSMGSTAASGGYYIACAADHVVAHPDTLTGSIGVISQFPNVEELLDKVGVDVVVITAGSVKDIGSPFREMTEEEQELWTEILTEVYQGFVAVVAEGRDLSLEQAEELADGRVYTGRQALELGLVDELGTLDDAIAVAAELGNIAGEPEVLELAPPPNFYDLITSYQARSPLLSIEELVEWGAVPSLEYRYVGP